MARSFVATGFIATIFFVTSFITTIFVTAIFVATKLFAPILGKKLAAGVVAPMIARRIIFRAIMVRRAGMGLDLILARLIFANLTLAHGGQVIGYSFFFVQADLAGVGADETFVEDAAGELVEVLFFEGTQHASADFGGFGDGIKPDALLLALLAKFFSECSQGRLRQTG